MSGTVVTEELSEDEGRAMFEGLVRDRLGLSRAEFLERLSAGDFDDTHSEDVAWLEMLIPFASAPELIAETS